MKVKVFITIDIDPEEYPIPADEDVGMEIEDGIREYFYDVDGAEHTTYKNANGVTQ